MDYEKKYKQALERAEEIIRYYKERNRGDEISIEDLETVFPELAESEDEKIRKEMITAFSRLDEDSTLCGVAYNYKKWIAWLEKQGTPAKLGEKEIQTAKDEMFPYQDNVGRSYEQAWAASGFELGAHWVLNKLKSNGYSDETYKQGEFGTFDAPQTPFNEVLEVTSRMQYISDDMKPIAEFIMDYANWDLRKEEWSQPTLTVPLFRVLDALIQRGKPYGECSQNIENQGEQKPTDKPISKEEILYQLVQNGTITEFDYLYLTRRFNITEPTKDYQDIDPHFGIPVDKVKSNLLTVERAKEISPFMRSGFENESADKVEPKFKNGQWIVWQDKCYKVNYNGCGYELVDQNGLSTSLEYGTVDENAHLWDITKDAKDGDVLAEDSCIFIIERMKPNGTAIIHCCLFDDGDFDSRSTLGFDVDSTYPATKEQRDTLMKAMADAGYEWDADKKELKKIEQKPAWSDEDEENLQHCCMAISADGLHTYEDKQEMEAWLKTIKDRIGG